MIKRLDISDALKYEFNSDDCFVTQDGKTYNFISFRKMQTMRYKKGAAPKYQTLTVRKQDWEEFKKWMLEILEPVPF